MILLGIETRFIKMGALFMQIDISCNRLEHFPCFLKATLKINFKSSDWEINTFQTLKE